MLSWATVNKGAPPELTGEWGIMRGGGVAMVVGLALHQALDVGGNVPTGRLRPQEVHRSELSSQGPPIRTAGPTCNTRKPPWSPQG